MRTHEVKIGTVAIGGDNPIAIQSMTNTRTDDVSATVAQIKELEKAGCDIIRCAVPDEAAARAIDTIKEKINIPLVADIHFDHRLAIMAMEHGADKIRINPGNIGSIENIKAVVSEASKRGIPIRVGVNSGSLEKELVEKYGGVTAKGLAESAIRNVRILEELDFGNIVISIKSSDTMMSVEAHEFLRGMTDHPIHVGITETGTPTCGIIKSSVGIGMILGNGIGDTVRVSLTADPVLEVVTAKRILKTLGLRKGGIDVIACPTCGRTRIDLVGLATKVEKLCENYDLGIKVAVMGCAVNGPGEAREADLGVAGGNGMGLIFRHGEIIRKVPESEILGELKKELDSYVVL
ncbi:MAG: flavodoxin-dependent (E)-4-hydroxy-3-methylbut-2-enyl-diphosphate synthase [Lachnospiraceae bacterium]|nr:flavodoxin-dependent (E)-4-hydroxy-3-methylbut-2-enyl-diphosphate synthase [Lachnospiraceae bacterium]